MARRFYVVTRDLHLYAGLFLSPFVVVFALSVFWLGHMGPRGEPPHEPTQTLANVPIAPEVEAMTGRQQVDALRPVLDHLGVHGEINFIRRVPKEQRLVIPVMLPGRETVVDLNVGTRQAKISTRETGALDALIHLHKMPGPHNVAVRGNAAYMRVWGVAADASGYGLLFLTLSGVYLWLAIKAERRTGAVLLGLGAVTFFGMVYALTV